MTCYGKLPTFNSSSNNPDKLLNQPDKVNSGFALNQYGGTVVVISILFIGATAITAVTKMAVDDCEKFPVFQTQLFERDGAASGYLWCILPYCDVIPNCDVLIHIKRNRT